jgi:hypothetical protein
MEPDPKLLAIRLDEFEKRFDERTAYHREALLLQAKEYERRLEALNGSHERIQEIQREQVRREVFDQVVAGLKDKVDEVRNFKANIEGRIWGIMAAVTVGNIIIASAASVLAAYWMRAK